MRRLTLFLCLFSTAALAQTAVSQRTVQVRTAAQFTGGCVNGSVGKASDTGAEYCCSGGAWGICPTSGALKMRYRDFDTDGDGTTDYREVGDQSGDGSLTITDIQTALDTLCDSNSDGTQNTKQFDTNGDGTLDTVNTCGTLVVLPGKYSATSPSYAGLNVKWDNVTILGYGALIDYQVPWSKILPRWGGSNTTYNGVLIAHTNQSTPIENVVFKGFHVYGSRSMLRSCIDPNQDGSTADKVAAANCLADSDGDGTNNNQGSQNDIVVINPRGVVVADNIVEGAYRQGLSVSSGNHDATPEAAGAVIENNEWRGEFGEHCMEADAPNLRIAKNKFSGCNGIVQAGAGAGTQEYTGNRAVEIYSPASALGRFLNGIVVEGNAFEQVQDGVAFIADAGASGTLDGLVVANNQFRGALRYGVSLDTPSGVTLQDITVTGNVYSTPLVGSDLYQLPVGTGRGGLIGVNTTSGKLDRLNISGNTVTLNSRGTNAAARTLTNDYAISVVAPASNGQVINISNNNITMFPDWYNTAIDAAIFASGYGVKIDGNTIHFINDTTIDWAGDGTLKDAPGIGVVASALNHSNVENNTILFDNTAVPPVDFGCISLTGGGSRSTFSRNTCIARKSAWGVWLGSGTYAHELVADNFMTTTTTGGSDTLAGFFWDNGNTSANPFVLRNNHMVGRTGGGSYLNVAASNNLTFEGNSCTFCTTTPQDADEAAGRGWGHMVDGANDGLDAYTLLTLFAKSHLKHGTGTVASAGTISVDAAGDVVTITGSTTINTINTCNAQSAGRPLTILCGSATAAFGDLVGNVDLSAAFTCTANDTISFMCDGTNWRETARAAN